MQQCPLIGLVMATYLEAKPFVAGLDCLRSSIGPFTAYRAENTVLVISGMGKTNAAMACACLCMSCPPACLVNIGAAGAAAEGEFCLGGIYQVSAAVEPDRPHFRTGLPFHHEADRLPGFEEARVATRDKPVVNPDKRREMAKIADLLDMESAAVIQAARKFQRPCFLFKLVSDTPEHTSEREIPAYIRQYRDSLFAFFHSRVTTGLEQRFG
ncbi:MAG TPA: hypothetical protein VKO20_00540 [Desulfosalsimonadaceae bacterium]|nr:hypothetical protein [Desulfosalsimonadaceae bacterium]